MGIHFGRRVIRILWWAVAPLFVAMRVMYAGPTQAGPRTLGDPQEFISSIESDDDPRALAGFVPIASLRFADVNGDLDGYADTNETIELFLTVHNPTRAPDLTNVRIEISSLDPKVDCVSPSAITIASLLAGADAETPVPFRLHVHPNAERAGASVACADPGPDGACSNFLPVEDGCRSDADCRRTADQDYSAILSVRITSDQVPVSPRAPQEIRIDLDLDVVTPSATTSTFVEGFESGLVNFVFMNLDDNRASNSASDGYRCQYNDPDFVNSNSYQNSFCYLGYAGGQDPVNDWHVDTGLNGGRAFLGTVALHYGKHLPSSVTTSLRQLDAIRTRTPIRLAARVCRDDPATDKRSCSTVSDCLPVGGGPCIAASPALLFKHQVSAWRRRPPSEAIDRAVVQVQPASGGVWEKVFPSTNIYNEQTQDYYSNCSFDPSDDGNDEDDYFDPSDPDRRLGPSSTCFPEFTFSHLGDTDEPFDVANIGRASDGPGLVGSVPPGTWVESRFDLSRYRGRSIRLRFLYTTLSPLSETGQTWAQYTGGAGGGEVGPEDDGWYVDDIRITQTLGSTSPTVAIDSANNHLLSGNLDGDARGDDCDCAPGDPTAFAFPGDLLDLRFAADKTTLTWQDSALSFGSGTVHEVVRGVLDELPVGSGGSEVCLTSGEPQPGLSDPDDPAAGTGFWYVVRARNGCGTGSYGTRSDGTVRTTAACP